jgi:hypothetical protein
MAAAGWRCDATKELNEPTLFSLLVYMGRRRRRKSNGDAYFGCFCGGVDFPLVYISALSLWLKGWKKASGAAERNKHLLIRQQIGWEWNRRCTEPSPEAHCSDFHIEAGRPSQP